VRHALATLERDAKKRFDVIVILQATSPFTQPEDIDGTIDLLLSSGADTAVSVMRLDHAVHPVKLKTMAGDRLLPYLEEERGRMAAADLPDVFVRNCSVYATRRAVIESGRIIGDDCRGYVMPRERSLDINESLDLELAEFLLARSRKAEPSP
jgi:CMP-N-acetylneuraminic acid synthetase